MRDDANKSKRKPAVEMAPATDGAAIRLAFLHHVDEQQHWAGFVTARSLRAGTDKDRPRGRDRR